MRGQPSLTEISSSRPRVKRGGALWLNCYALQFTARATGGASPRLQLLMHDNTVSRTQIEDVMGSDTGVVMYERYAGS